MEDVLASNQTLEEKTDQIWRTVKPSFELQALFLSVVSRGILQGTSSIDEARGNKSDRQIIQEFKKGIISQIRQEVEINIEELPEFKPDFVGCRFGKICQIQNPAR